MIYFIDWNDDYEKIMISYLKKENNIKEMSVLSKSLYSINKKIKKYEIENTWLLKKYIQFKYRGISKDDILIFKESLFFKYIDIAKHLECKKILLLRSSLRESKDVDFVIANKVFNKIYSFDKEDCKKEKLVYLKQFFPFGFNEIEKIIENIKPLPKQCFFLGRDKGRIEEIEHIAKKLEEKSQLINFHVVKDKTSLKKSKYYISNYLSYDENIRNALASEVLIEINREGQSGLTLRALEAIFFKKN
ncbi:lipopolysaccharide core biosynthesis protein [Pectobacterium atrosepticum ICMP 1526]|uniref:hypothetical protein n=1 Tax=Pectobacterium atrosepticum TaxID=29471 RepID=UPI00065D80AA|nr:hypothetical protein [Pectobacterium atrosepticum]KMK83511.1 lipopolysaccharide core biosynthesis protein [Pectobacterium atrosepticum ICMP 1526]